MINLEARFHKSSSNYEQCPSPDRPEYAFIGRSNVGKSSLINMLVNQKSLAKTSQTPGKTQLINHYQVSEAWYLVDLPGYGFAKVPKHLKDQWMKMIEGYLLHRTNLIYTFVLIDSRLTPQAIDLDFIRWGGQNDLPLALVFTKIDKLSMSALHNNIALFKEELLKEWEEMPPYFLTSSEKKIGREEIIQFMTNHNKVFQNF